MGENLNSITMTNLFGILPRNRYGIIINKIPSLNKSKVYMDKMKINFHTFRSFGRHCGQRKFAIDVYVDDMNCEDYKNWKWDDSYYVCANEKCKFSERLCWD